MSSTDAGAARTWVGLNTHRAWLMGQAQRLLDFFRSSLARTAALPTSTTTATPCSCVTRRSLCPARGC